MSRKQKGGNKSKTWTAWHAEHENPKQDFDNIVSLPKRTSPTSETKPGSAKKVANAAKEKQMTERSLYSFPGLERARDAVADSPVLNDQRTTLTKEIRKLKLDKNLGVEIERKKGFTKRESARLLSLEESRLRMTTEIS